MARTIRRKNWFVELSKRFSRRHGFKTNGHFTTWDIYVATGNGHEGYPVYRAMTQAEINAEKLRVHGESKHGNAWGPGKYYKKRDNRLFKHRQEIELRKALMDPEYDPQFSTNIVRVYDPYYW